jgi:hypothetical protein
MAAIESVTDIESWVGLTLTALGASGRIAAALEVAQPVFLQAARRAVPEIGASGRWLAEIPATAGRVPVCVA